MGFLEILGIVFIILKLVGVISWSWFWVLSPILLSVVLYIICIILKIISEVYKT